MKESALVTKIIKAVKLKYPKAYVRKLSDRYSRGLPDILIIVKANVCVSEEYHLTVFVETKVADGVASKIQISEMFAIEKAGASVLIARNVDTVLSFLAAMGAIS